jgi:LysM repeat protein
MGKAIKQVTKAVSKAAPKIKVKAPKIKVKVPKIKVKVPKKVNVGKALGLKSLGKAVSKVGSGAINLGKDVTKTIAKSKGDLISQVGRTVGSKDLVNVGKNVTRESSKGIDKYGDLAGNLALNAAIPGYSAVSSLANMAAGGKFDLAQAASAVGSLVNLPPAALKALKTVEATQKAVEATQALSKGDLKGAALSGLSGGLGAKLGLNPNLASAGISALTGDKKGLVSGLASQFGAGGNVSQMLGGLAGGDLKGSALQALGSYGGFNPEQLKMAQAGVSALTGDKSGLASSLVSQFGAGATASDMIGQFAGGRGAREVFSDQAGAYVKNEANDLLDKMDMAGMGRDQVRAIQDMQASAQGAYKIAQGDTFNAIAKRLGISPEELKAANPQIQDINKIAAGANLNIPGMGQMGGSISGARKSITDKYLKDASGKTIMGPNNAPIINPDYNEQAADELANQQQGGMTQQNPGIWDQVKSGAGSVFGGIRDFAAENKGLIGTAAQAGAAGLGYMASKEAMEEQQRLLNEQLSQEQSMGEEFMEIDYDPDRYAQERKFLEETIQGSGRSAITQKMEQESIQKAARTAAAGRLAGLEQQARLGGAALGTAGLAASLAGAQSGQNVMAEDMRARDVEARNELQRATTRLGQLSSQETSEEAELSRQKFGVESARASSVGGTRSDMGQLQSNRASALANLYTSGANLVKTTLGGLEPAQQQPAQQQPAQQQPAQRQPAPSLSPEKVAAARTLSQAPSIQQPKPAPTNRDQFNEQNMPKPGEGKGYGVLAPAAQLAQQAQQKVQQGQKAVENIKNTANQAQQKFEQLKKNPLGMFGIK